MTARVPAKINPYLGVGARRDDGFHELVTLFCSVSLYDEVTLETAHGAAGALEISVSGLHSAGVPVDETNLAARAVRLLAVEAGRAVPESLRLHLTKGIPVAGGMAGGSADAAGALLAAATLWGADAAVLPSLAARLGSDVPFSLAGGAAVGSGRGERLAPVEAPAPFWWVVAAVDGGLSTPAVYAEFDRLAGEGWPVDPPDVPEAMLAALAAGDAGALAGMVHNDLQEAACSLRPELRTTLAHGRSSGALASLLSGSGPTCLFLAENEEHAGELAAAVSTGPHVLRSDVVSGPVSGAHVALSPTPAKRAGGTTATVGRP